MAPVITRAREIREGKGLSREAVAFRAGVSVSTVLRIERGRSATSKNLKAVATALGVPLSALFEEVSA